MNVQMAYLLGMTLGNGEIHRGNTETTISIDIPHKNLIDDEGREVPIYVRASISNIRNIIEPLIGNKLTISDNKSSGRSTIISFSKPNEDYAMREILRLINNGVRHSTMTMNRDLFNMTKEEKRALLRGVADVTGYIRASNIAFGQEGHHRVYIEVPGNWQIVIDLANILKDLDVPIQTIDFGHPNFRDSNLKKYNEGKTLYWKKEHQLKIWANEFLAVGFNIAHKERALEKYAKELLTVTSPETTHKYYWEKPIKRKNKPSHPGENDESFPANIRGKHFESWTDLARELGYHE